MQLSSWSCHSAVFSSLYSQGLWMTIKNPQHKRFPAKQQISLRFGAQHIHAHLTSRKHQELGALGPGCASRYNAINTMCRRHKESPEVPLTEEKPQLLKTPSRTQCPDPDSANTSGTSAASLQTGLLRVVSGCGESLVLLHGDRSSGSSLTFESCALADLVAAAQGKELQEVSTLYRIREEEQEIQQDLQRDCADKKPNALQLFTWETVRGPQHHLRWTGWTHQVTRLGSVLVIA